MMRVVNKVLLTVSTEPNIMEISDNNIPIQVYRYTFQHRTRRYFWLTTKVGDSPLLPSQRKASVWEQDAFLTRLLARNCFLPDERQAKWHIGFGDVDGALMLDTCRTSVPTSGNTDNAAAAPAADETLFHAVGGSLAMQKSSSLRAKKSMAMDAMSRRL
jgi:hypothetical protein